MNTLSVIVITKDEEDRLDRCLSSVQDIADEIVVVDSGSTDNTVNIAKKYTDKVLVTDWPGYGPQKQRALEQATCDWVLSIDADEALDENAKLSVNKLLQQTKISASAYRLPWKTIFLGKSIRFGRSARSPKRLFRREGASFSQDLVHEKVITSGSTQTIDKGYLLHYSVRNFEHLLEKNRKYSWLTSEKYYKKNKKSYGVYVAVLRSLITFIQIYIFRLGFLDGSRGLILAGMFTQRTFNKYVGLWSLETQEKMQSDKD
ncbi:glycosyl transferase [Thalassotalea sp. 42_200_T64]|nr:glycosyl transferase [Thalassotalea sp. 42_200_T64]